MNANVKIEIGHSTCPHDCPSACALDVEVIDGTTIGELQRTGPMPVADVITMLRDVSDLLAHAHGRGVVHRQLTAHTIIKTADRAHGYSVVSWDNALTLDTQTRVSLDTRDDVFALGVVAFRALTGVMPDVQTTREAFPAAPAELASLIDQMLERDPNRRPAVPITVINELMRFVTPTASVLEYLGTDQPKRALPPASAEPNLQSVSDIQGRRVLIVDDDTPVRMLVRSVLQRSGYTVLEAQNGGEAVLLAEEHPGAIDLLITDVVLPRMSGPQLAERQRRARPELKVLFMSGYAEHALHGREAEAHVLDKPFNAAALLVKVRSVLDDRTPT